MDDGSRFAWKTLLAMLFCWLIAACLLLKILRNYAVLTLRAASDYVCCARSTAEAIGSPWLGFRCAQACYWHALRRRIRAVWIRDEAEEDRWLDENAGLGRSARAMAGDFLWHAGDVISRLTLWPFAALAHAALVVPAQYMARPARRSIRGR